jgi:hypothetical protein
MPTKKGKSKPAKARKTANKARRGRVTTARKTTKKAATPARRVARKRGAGKLRRTEAGPVWIGSSPAPVNIPTNNPGGQKASDGQSVVIL